MILKNTFMSAFALGFGLVSSVAFGAEVAQLQYLESANAPTVEISGTGLSGFTKEEKTNPPQLVLTFKNATVGEGAAKKLGENQKILQVSAYPVSAAIAGKPDARVVVDLKKAATYSVSQKGNKILVKVTESLARVPQTANSVKMTASSADSSSMGDALAEPAAQTPLDQAMGATQDKQKFTGSPITLKLKDADVHEVLRLISETSGFNIVVNPAVVGKITLSLDRVPWDQALEVVLSTLKLGAERNESVLRVMPKEMLLAEKQQELDTQKLVDASAPRVTRIFPISYADLNQLSTLLNGFSSAQAGGATGSGQKVTILVDATTQSLVVRDTADNVEKIRKMIEILDVQTPQVMIEGKVVETTEGQSKSIGGTFGVGSPHYGFAFNGPQALIGFPSISNPLGATGAGSFGGADIFSIAGRALTVRATLDALENQSKIKVVSSPRTVVMSGKSSSITQTTARGVLLTTPATATSPATQQIVNITANTSLKVTPRVTNDGSVLMKLDLTRDVLTGSDTAPVAEPRMMSTEVVVGSGDTLVIGGILSSEENTTSSGVPFLRNIPLVGWFFGKDTSSTDKTELMFFVTPKIINQKKAGISTEVNGGAAPPSANL